MTGVGGRLAICRLLPLLFSVLAAPPNHDTPTVVVSGGSAPLSFADVASLLPLLDVLAPPPGVAPHVAADGAGFPLLAAAKTTDQAMPKPATALEDAMLDPLVAEVLARARLSLPYAPPSAAACRADADRYCADLRRPRPPTARKPSVLRCLSAAAAQVSVPCYEQFSHSLPHLCSDAVDNYCDLTQQGVLACLEQNQAKLKGECAAGFSALERAVVALREARRVEIVGPGGHVLRLLKDADTVGAWLFRGLWRVVAWLGVGVAFFVVAGGCVELYVGDTYCRFRRRFFERRHDKAILEAWGDAQYGAYGATLTI